MRPPIFPSVDELGMLEELAQPTLRSESSLVALGEGEQEEARHLVIAVAAHEEALHVLPLERDRLRARASPIAAQQPKPISRLLFRLRVGQPRPKLCVLGDVDGREVRISGVPDLRRNLLVPVVALEAALLPGAVKDKPARA